MFKILRTWDSTDGSRARSLTFIASDSTEDESMGAEVQRKKLAMAFIIAAIIFFSLWLLFLENKWLQCGYHRWKIM